MKVKGFTLIELVLVVMVIAILVSISIPTYFQTVERARAREARSTLESIFAAQRSYSAERRAFINLPVGTAAADNVIWQAVGMENPNTNANASFTYSTAGAPGAFTATASRTTGPNTGETITVTNGGVWGGDWAP